MDLIEHFAKAGFDVLHPFDAHAVARDVGIPLLVDDERRCGWLVANTRALWPRLLAARAADAALAASDDPIERYLEQTCAALPDARVVFAHQRYDGTFVPFQRIAVAAGLGSLAFNQLVIHPTYGPWIALRAVVLTRGEPITLALPPPACDCGDRCRAAFDRARQPESTWRDWLAVRDACCVGRVHRYSDNQIAYHYTKSQRLLRRGD